MLSSILCLISPNLPIGGFSYSQALESFVETGEICNAQTFKSYLKHTLKRSIAKADLPLLIRLYKSDLREFEFWTNKTLAFRNTKELRDEEINKGKALVRVIKSLKLENSSSYLEIANKSYLSAFALFSRSKKISLNQMLESYCFSYIESQCIAAIKLVPIGQTDAWQIIDEFSNLIDEQIQTALSVDDFHIGSGLVNLSILSVLHETQYSRIFRS